MLGELEILEIGPDDQLWRHISRDKLDKAGAVTKRAFILPNKEEYEPDPRVSVYLAKISDRDQVKGQPWHAEGAGAGELIAGPVRNADTDPPNTFTVYHDPNREYPINTARSIIEGSTTLTHCEILARLTILILDPRA